MPTFSPLGNVPRIFAKSVCSVNGRMIRRMTAVRISAFLLAGFALHCAAAPSPATIGNERFSPQRFGEFADAAQRELGERVPAGKIFTEYFDQQPLGKSSVVGELRRDPEVRSLLLGARVPPNTRLQPPGAPKQQYALSTISLLLVRGKALSLTVYSAYDSQADLDWIRAITARWIDDLQRLNTR